MEKDLYYELILDKYLDEKNLTEEQAKLLEEAEKYFIEKSKQNMGIGMLSVGYIFTKENQDVWQEYAKVKNFIDGYVCDYVSNLGKNITDFSLEFINYGRTQIVYVLTDNLSNEKITILAKQPVVEYGKVRQEAENLKILKQLDCGVVAPIDYYTNGEQELYVTPYINQARCVASDGKWGMYVPEPFYRFEYFSAEQESVVNTCMIAKLVSYYDFDKKQGIAACKLGGGDFMLPKGWESQTPKIKDTLASLYFIAAREMIECSFEEYLNILRDEFSRATINEEQDGLIVNHRGRVPMNVEDIESGIALGKQIINDRVGKTEGNQKGQ